MLWLGFGDREARTGLMLVCLKLAKHIASIILIVQPVPCDGSGGLGNPRLLKARVEEEGRPRGLAWKNAHRTPRRGFRSAQRKDMY